VFERSKKGEHALLIQPHIGRLEEAVLEEFIELAHSAGASIAASITARIDHPNPSILIGSGKLDEVKAALEASEADLVLVNHALTPVQERNLEQALERRVLDRTGLILDIFAQRARSFEGKLQVELAQLRHLSTRLVRGWTHLERQRGGAIGLRGPGETQLETDRRLLQKRVEQLQKRLAKVEVQHAQMRRARVRSELPRVALVGYTNAGKSTLFNALTDANAYAANQLFATLDPTVRRISLPGGHAMLADTVGFIRDLPHELVAAFRSTLSEAREADLLLHLVDASDPLREERIAQVDEVLEAVGAGDLPQLLVYNKIDQIEGAAVRHDAPDGIPDPARRERVWLCAQDGRGLEVLQSVLGKRLGLHHVSGIVRLGPSAGRLRSHLHQLEVIRSEQSDEDGWLIEVDIPLAQAQKLASTDEGQALRPLLPEPQPHW